MNFFQRYKKAMEHKHGWEVELRCPHCGFQGKPEYRGWKPGNTINFGNSATIFSDLICAQCKKDIKETAAKKLVELFAPVAVPAGNKKMLIGFLALIFAVPLLCHALWGPKAAIFFPLALIFILPAILFFNYRIALLRQHCQCGNPQYLFMGLLGRSYCYRCSSCGRLLRIRD